MRVIPEVVVVVAAKIVTLLAYLVSTCLAKLPPMWVVKEPCGLAMGQSFDRFG